MLTSPVLLRRQCVCRAASIVQAMIDYRGTTAAALQAMIDRGFKAAVGAGLSAASAKAAAMAAG